MFFKKDRSVERTGILKDIKIKEQVNKLQVNKWFRVGLVEVERQQIFGTEQFIRNLYWKITLFLLFLNRDGSLSVFTCLPFTWRYTALWYYSFKNRNQIFKVTTQETNISLFIRRNKKNSLLLVKLSILWRRAGTATAGFEDVHLDAF